MHVQTVEPHVREPRTAGEPAARLVNAHAEFVLGPAGGDLRVRPRIDVRIDARRRVRADAELRQQTKDAEIAVGFYRVADGGVQAGERCA